MTACIDHKSYLLLTQDPSFNDFPIFNLTVYRHLNYRIGFGWSRLEADFLCSHHRSILVKWNVGFIAEFMLQVVFYITYCDCFLCNNEKKIRSCSKDLNFNIGTYVRNYSNLSTKEMIPCQIGLIRLTLFYNKRPSS